MPRASVLQMVSSSNLDDNLARAGRLVERAAAEGAQLLVLPEVFACLGSRAQLLASTQTSWRGQVFSVLRELAITHGVWLVAGAVPWREPDAPMATLPYSRCAVIDARGAIVAHYDKVHLFDAVVEDATSSYRESDLFSAGRRSVIVDTPVGRLGLAICYDLRFPELFRAQCMRGVDLFAVPSAFTRVTGAAHWRVLLRARAIENSCYLLAANQGGQHSPSRATYGHSAIVDPWGEELAVLGEGEGVASATIDLARVASIRRDMPCREHIRFGLQEPDVDP